MSKRASPTLIGAFVVGAVILALVGTAVIGSGRLFSSAQRFVLYFDSDVNGLLVGAPVKFRGVEIGSVVEILLSISSMGVPVSQPEGSHLIPVIIELEKRKIQQKGGNFGFDDPAMLAATIDAGLRAQLALESFVTGLLYIKLDLDQSTPVRLINDPAVSYAEIPTVPTPLEKVQMKATQFLMKLEEVDFAGLLATLQRTIEGMDRFLNSDKLDNTMASLDDTLFAMRETTGSIRMFTEELRADVGPLTESLARTVDTAEGMLQHSRVVLTRLEGALEPDAPLQYQLRATLHEMSTAARAVRVLADAIERNPSILVRGRAKAEESQE